MNFWQSHFPNQPTILLDGALSTELERLGYDISGVLWSAKLLKTAPKSIQQLHYDYLCAGADIITTATYQASFQGFAEQGIDRKEAEGLLRESVILAKAARKQFWEAAEDSNRHYPLIAASIGPYGAYLADGSEYSGNYNLSTNELIHFHRDRLECLLQAQPDLIAFETIPSYKEALAITQLLKQFAAAKAWISFSCKDGTHISDGTPLSRLVKEIQNSNQIVAIGVNCTAPVFVSSLISEIKGNTDKTIIVYPNSGENWDADQRCWLPATEKSSYAQLAVEWKQAGATIIGGCCRTGVEDIRVLAKNLEMKSNY
ncbi:MAG: homocysteine S-methyltransferase [Chitinophagales bacterium]|nr:homocysteine S-methyltransferase [Chitinophagales bacterium]